MLNRAELERALALSYPKDISQLTQNKRKRNIESLERLIESANQTERLVFGSREERICLYTTSVGERITIQYPGQETINSDPQKVKPYDFRPRIILPDGTIVRDLNFADMWSILETVNKDYHLLTRSLSALFFRMGRMIDYEFITEDYAYELIDVVSNSTVMSGNRTLSWYKFELADEIMEKLNHDVFSVLIDDDTEISFEAFLYFFSLILENEDIKYFYQKRNLSSGRIPTSDSMLLLASYFSGTTSISTLLQKYVSGFGVGKCTASEIEPATSGLIKIVNRKKDIIGLLKDNNIPYKEDSSIQISRTNINVAIKITTPKTAILRSPDPNKENLLSSKDWIVFDIETITLDDTRYSNLLDYLGLVSP